MTDSETEIKQSKSVAFNEGSVIMDTNGQVTDAPPVEQKPAEDPEVNEVTEMFKGLSKKKKSSKKSKTDQADGEGEEGEFDPSALKKKKKSSKSKPKPDDFEAKLAEAGVTEEVETQPEEIPEGDPDAGTGIWAHDATQAIPYSLLSRRIFSLIQSKNPDFLPGASKLKIPPPQCLREGSRRTVWANMVEICDRMNRSYEHCMQFLFAELGTSGSVDGGTRLVIKGRFQQKGIESVLRKYIKEYVICRTCNSPFSTLTKGENRLTFATCKSCGSSRSVAAIKTGFRGQVGRRKRA